MAYAITAHAIDQCEERHGYRPTLAQGDAAVGDILAGRALMAWRHPHGSEEWIVRLGHAEVRVVYSPADRRIITVQPTTKRGLAHNHAEGRALKPKRYRNGRVMPAKLGWGDGKA